MQNENSIDYFGSVVKSARLKKGLTQVQLAALLHISTRYLKAIENSGRKPSYDLLIRIIQELSIPTEKVFRLEQKKGKCQLSLYLCGKNCEKGV
jgi:Predicted transcriptional regulators